MTVLEEIEAWASTADVETYNEMRERALEEFFRAYAIKILALAGGSQRLSAELAGMDRSNWRRYLRLSRPPSYMGKKREPFVAPAAKLLPGARKGNTRPL